MGDKATATQRMDGETALAFAGHAFEELHPQHTWPEWFRRGTVPSYSITSEGDYIVSFAVTLKESQDTDVFFRVLINHRTAETKVLENKGLESYEQSDLVLA